MSKAEQGWSLQQIQDHVATNLPMIGLFGMEMTVATPERCDLLIHSSRHIFRPGGSVAGPVLFAAADAGAYGLVLAAGGPPEATTVDLIIHFLRPGTGLPLLARTVPVKMGRRLITTETTITPADAPDRLLTRATSTYMVP